MSCGIFRAAKECLRMKCFVISPIGLPGSEIREQADAVLDYIIEPIAIWRRRHIHDGRGKRAKRNLELHPRHQRGQTDRKIGGVAE